MDKGYVVLKVVGYISATDACMALQRYLHMNCVPLTPEFRCDKERDMAQHTFYISISQDKVKV